MKLEYRIMTATEKYLADLPTEIKSYFTPIFGDIDRFYATCYLIARNRHQLELEKGEMWEEKMQTVHFFQNKIEQFLKSFPLNGKDISADIASDYFDDFVNYQERDFDLSNEEFISILKRIQSDL